MVRQASFLLNDTSCLLAPLDVSVVNIRAKYGQGGCQVTDEVLDVQTCTKDADGGIDGILDWDDAALVDVAVAQLEQLDVVVVENVADGRAAADADAAIARVLADLSLLSIAVVLLAAVVANGVAGCALATVPAGLATAAATGDAAKQTA